MPAVPASSPATPQRLAAIGIAVSIVVVGLKALAYLGRAGV